MIRSWNATGFKLLLLPAVAAGLWFMAQGEQAVTTEGEPQRQDITRAADKVKMQDADLQTGMITFIRADKVVEKQGRFLTLDDVVIDRADKVHVVARTARYDLKLSRLDVTGHIVLTTPDGMRGDLQSLTWEKASGRAWTDDPVRLTTTDGVITARKAVMQKDMEEISLIGDVYAKMAGDTFRGKFVDGPAAEGR
ncbi:MAG TPA: LPS export ABC transporter periplasmic protein LptC [Deltaproteobacteria bacterium]|nr:LPS export ABC transporter periplasmic protein LptC [Deltaproteobacteria bacterium]